MKRNCEESSPMTSGLRLCHLALTTSGLDQVPKHLPAAVDFKVESVTAYSSSCPTSTARRSGTRGRCRPQEPCRFLRVLVRRARRVEGPRSPENPARPGAERAG